MADQGLDLAPLGLHLSRHGTGRLTHLPCENGKGYVPYVKNILKKLSVEAESNHGDVLDELYEQYAYIMTSLKVCLIYQVVQLQGNCWCHFNVPSTCLKEIQG
ncbi:uncharacterized protein LOC123204187 isoform X3 [Mangifera indica]|uniref:uncharacterized protein LOC123204187 isoform X3 n=1 Tax=Mangifera indica TaxID=29780 RepID=UPI001CF9CFEB|nr:uncharacterized protein LOC123204187 isoform X3 [Mangifera indica]